MKGVCSSKLWWSVYSTYDNSS